MREFLNYGVVGPVGSYDRGLLLFDGFEGTFAWDGSGTGIDWSANRFPSTRYHGSYGASLGTRTTNPAAGDYVQMSRSIPHPYRSKIFCRLRFLLGAAGWISHFKIQLDIYNGIKHRRASLRYVPAVPSCQYLNSLGSWSSLSSLAVNLPNLSWQQIDFALDLNLNQYVEAYLSGKYADMRTIGFYEVEVSTDRKMDITLYLEASSANSATMWLDDVFVGEHVVI